MYFIIWGPFLYTTMHALIVEMFLSDSSSLSLPALQSCCYDHKEAGALFTAFYFTSVKIKLISMFKGNIALYRWECWQKTVTCSKQTSDVHDMHHNLLSHRDTPNHGLFLNVDNHTYNFHVYIRASPAIWSVGRGVTVLHAVYFRVFPRLSRAVKCADTSKGRVQYPEVSLNSPGLDWSPASTHFIYTRHSLAWS